MKYSGTSITSVFSVSISGPNAPYDFTWSVPYWPANSYAKDVFIQLTINSILTGQEQIFVYIKDLYVSDSNGYQMLVRNTTSKTEYLPLASNLQAQDYISPAEQAAIAGAGTGVIISLVGTLGFNALVSLLSTGSMEIMWTFINVIQLVGYIPNLQLNYPTLLTLMFSYLQISNGNIIIVQNYFFYIFNINADTFPNDYSLTNNLNNNSYNSM